MNLAVLDTHILSWLRDRQVSDVPKATPTRNEEYVILEMIFLEMTKRIYPHMSPASIDLIIWAEQSGRKTDE
jgi:thermostable 8-oxoguanine DNA glycosylase